MGGERKPQCMHGLGEVAHLGVEQMSWMKVREDKTAGECFPSHTEMSNRLLINPAWKAAQIEVSRGLTRMGA